MLNVRTSILDGAPSPASGGTVRPELLSLPSNVLAISALALALGLLLVLGAVAALLAVQRRRRATAHYAALLAGSTPIGLTPSGGELAEASSSRAASAGASRALEADGSAGSRRSSPAASTAQAGDGSPRSTRTPLGDEVPRSTRASVGDGGPRSSRDGSPSERSSPRSAAPPSGINVPPPSERQWQSQPPPRIGKEPPG